MLKHTMNLALICALLCSTVFAAEAFPRVSGETLSEKTVALPDIARSKSAVLVISFTRAAQTQTRAWGEGLKKELPNIARYQVLELEDVPRLFRGFVKSSIRKSIPKEDQDKFILLFEGQDSLKKIVNFQNDSEAYVLFVDANGNVQWREHGAVSDLKMTALGKIVE